MAPASVSASTPNSLLSNDADVVEQLRGAPRVEPEEDDAEHEDDEEHAAAQRLAQRVRGDDERAAHADTACT